MNIGIMQGRLTPPNNNKIQSFPWNNWENEFTLARNRVDLIEWTIDEHNIDYNPIFKNIKKIEDLCHVNNINVKSVTCDFLMENPFYKNKNNNIDSYFYLNKLIEKCKELKISYIIFPLVDNGKIDNNDQEKNLIKQLVNPKIIDNLNSKILFESDFNPIKLKKFISNFDRDFFGINYDTGNSASLGYNIKEEFDCYYDRIENIHIKDRKLNSNSVKLGNGDFDFQLFFKLLGNNGYLGNLIFQTARDKNNFEIENLEYNLSFIRKYL